MGANPSDGLPDQQVIDKHNLVAPQNLISMARLLLFGRVAIKAPEYVLHVPALAARTSNYSWLAAGASALCRLQHRIIRGQLRVSSVMGKRVQKP